jgi:hypothetical protein
MKEGKQGLLFLQKKAPRPGKQKNFCSPSGGAEPQAAQRRPKGRKSFLVLFFKKELLPCLAFFSMASPAHAVSFCVDRANPMFAVDEAVAAAAVPGASFVVRDSSTDDEDQDSGRDQVKFFDRLSQKCDLIMDFPVEAGHADLPDGMAASAPYTRTGFVAASTGAVAKTFPAMTASGKVGVVFLTPASTYFTAANVGAEEVFYTNGDLYSALVGGQIRDAVIWQPWLVHQLAAHPRPVNSAFLAMPHTVWDVVAIYPAGGGRAAVAAFDAGLRRLAGAQKLAGLIAPYQTP